MDPLTHIFLTRRLVGPVPHITIAGIGPDLPFYLTYPAMVISQGGLTHALSTNDWPAPPRWLETLHHAFHSLPVALAGAGLIRMLTGRWPGRELSAWTLHILVDIPTHSRQRWGPQFLWPLSDYAVDGISWIDILQRYVRVSEHKS